jgi:hypothetical protein
VRENRAETAARPSLRKTPDGKCLPPRRYNPSMNQPSRTRDAAPAAPSIAATLERFVAGFNTQSLDEVMAFFADDAV